MPPQGSLRVALDHGRGFVHALALRLGDGALFSALAPVGTGDPARASALAIRRLLEQAGADPGDIRSLVHSVSAAAGAFAAGEALPLGLLVTAGFPLLPEWDGREPRESGGLPFRLVPPGRPLEIGGRLDAAGKEIAPLDEEALRAAAWQFREGGVEAAAACFLHAPANPAHERRAREIFGEVHPACRLTLSSEAGEAGRERERALAALRDAASGLLIRRALGEAAVRAAESPRPDTPILFLRSDGSAMPAHKVLARPLSAALSGPAGGALAAAALARALRIRRAVALDIGCASAKIALIEDGALPVASADSETPGVEVACLPLPGSLPAAFHALGWLAEAPAGEESVGAGSPAEAAWEAVQDAQSAIASAVQKATAGAGKNPRDFTLIACGGAGPLLAPGVAAALGMAEVVVPPRAAWFGALGLLDPDRRNEYAHPLALTLREGSEAELDRRFGELEREAAEDLEAAGVPAGTGIFLRAADMRYRGDPWRTRVDFPPASSFAASIEAALAAFHEVFRYQYGFGRGDRAPVEIACLRLTALGKAEGSARPEAPSGAGSSATPWGHREARLSPGEKLPLPIHRRGDLPPGTRLRGPAFIEEEGSTALLPPDASAEVDASGNLRLRLPVPEEGPELREELAAGALESAERGAESFLRRSMRSRYVQKMGLCGAAFFDLRGRKLTGRPIAGSVLPLIESGAVENLGPGDLIFWNDAHLGGSLGRPAEVFCCAPVRHRGEPAGYFLVCAHHEDLGGAAPGSFSPAATQTFQEGTILPPLRLWEGGGWNEAALALLLRNSRKREDLLADLEAQAAAARAGAARAAEAAGRLGAEAFAAALEGLLARSRRGAEEIIARLPDGAWSMEDHIESDGVDPGRLHTLKLKLAKGDGRLRLDLRGCSLQARGPINWPAQRDGGAFLRMWLAPLLQRLGGPRVDWKDGAWNEGAASLLELLLPEGGSLISPAFPAAVNMGHLTLQRLRSLLLGALGLASRGRVPADQEGAPWWGLRGRDRRGRFFLFREPLGGGTGAGPGGDGADGVIAFPAGGGLWAEETEAEFPLRVERLALAHDSGGAGKLRGGLGLQKEVRVLCDCEVFALADRAWLSPWGVNGGRAGGRFSLVSNPGTPVAREAPAFGQGMLLREGDLIRIVTAGGGGWGDPAEREPERVREDVLRGKVSPDQALKHYGVVLNPDTLRLDLPGTQAFRQFMRARRGRLPFFDRGPNYASVRGQAGG
ncbi:MAG: hydantoinase B/oxoprolinase family protein [Candidatus Tectomicrobia bacterium]|uniref:Hydantoinase B/oxoprolinase family protein n=1 Tax=Tectimicrobiota bacterium TaxID=2528274 RepID=A0A932HZB3_UNCTE|nr:hydantoinase B/oxoprolinase family protein [Candidatus Tectomicrobia bacterium]